MVRSEAVLKCLPVKNQSWIEKDYLEDGLNRKLLLLVVIVIGSLATSACAQKFDNQERARMGDVLRMVADDVKKHYYDPKMQGFDFYGREREAQEKLQKSTSLAQSLNIIAWTLDGLNDSHTRFVPPGRTTRQDYGFRMSMVGSRCYVTQVKPKSDADAKGLKPGDEIVSINTIAPTRDTLPILQYIYAVLAPQPGLRLQVRSPEGSVRDLAITATMRRLQKIVDLTGGRPEDIHNLIWEAENADHMTRTRCLEFQADDLGICKMPEFNFDYSEVRDLIKDARKHKHFILDLRDNPGGYAETLTDLVAGFFDHEIKVADRTGRRPNMTPLVAKYRKDPFTEKFVVLIDSESASASELFARVMQLEKRAIVIGDRSAGAVMEARFYEHQLGMTTAIFFGTSVTDANLIMADGKSLEHTGVTPDEVVLPGAADLAAGRDPALERAAEILGVKISAEKAGRLFPYEWPKL
jgi:C-terminal processing protease CtpA/Prc